VMRCGPAPGSSCTPELALQALHSPHEISPHDTKVGRAPDRRGAPDDFDADGIPLRTSARPACVPQGRPWRGRRYWRRRRRRGHCRRHWRRGCGRRGCGVVSPLEEVRRGDPAARRGRLAPHRSWRGARGELRVERWQRIRKSYEVRAFDHRVRPLSAHTGSGRVPGTSIREDAAALRQERARRSTSPRLSSWTSSSRTSVGSRDARLRRAMRQSRGWLASVLLLVQTERLMRRR
jgi:hypothetical protein